MSAMFLFGSIFLMSMVKQGNSMTTSKYDDKQELKEEALVILKNKCNTCHVKQNPFKVFSMRNMDRLAPKIEKQVFTLKRMPKGNSIKLTAQERETLREWIKSTK